jgi:hypothetical protein
MKQRKIFSLRESDDYDKKDYGFAKSPDWIDFVIYQGYSLEEEWQEPIFQLEYGVYADFISNDCAWAICSLNLKEFIESNIEKLQDVVWLPVRVENKEEIRQFYACHVTSHYKYKDVLNIEKSKKLRNGEIYLPCFDESKLKGIHIFSLENHSSSLFISPEMKNMLDSENFTGMGFEEWPTIN